MKDDERLESALRIIPIDLRRKLLKAVEPYNSAVQEVVLRAEKPLCVYVQGEEKFLNKSCVLTSACCEDSIVVTTKSELSEVFAMSCGYSVYSHLNEICEGFVTIKGGHRVGICGTAVVSDGAISNVRDISTISIRIAREFIGCAENLVGDIVSNSNGILICGSPSSGKTTLLRDIARTLSVAYKAKVSVVDTRGEIAACANGVSQNDLGLCDILNGYPRAVGIEQAIRSLSPRFIVCDEIGNQRDVDAVLSGVNSGVSFVATIHAATKEELMNRYSVDALLKKEAFNKVVFLCGRDNPGKIRRIYTKDVLLNA